MKVQRGLVEELFFKGEPGKVGYIVLKVTFLDVPGLAIYSDLFEIRVGSDSREIKPTSQRILGGVELPVDIIEKALTLAAAQQEYDFAKAEFNDLKNQFEESMKTYK